jgi:hypothetical protein
VRSLVGIILIVYLIGVGVELSPIFRTGWYSSTAAELSVNLLNAIPDAFAWPVHVYRKLTGTPSPTPAANAT